MADLFYGQSSFVATYLCRHRVDVNEEVPYIYLHCVFFQCTDNRFRRYETQYSDGGLAVRVEAE